MEAAFTEAFSLVLCLPMSVEYEMKYNTYVFKNGMISCFHVETKHRLHAVGLKQL